MSDLTAKLESLIRAGKRNEARKCLRALNYRKVARADALQVANVARRSGLPTLSLRLLNPIIRPESRVDTPATPEEKIEYAACLRSSGVTGEARELMETLDRRAHPEVAFQIAACLVTEWRYAEAIPFLREYLDRVPEFSYAGHVGELNLLAALVHDERLDAAREQLRVLRGELDPTRHGLLYQNSLELEVQLEVLSQDWPAANAALATARRYADQARDPVQLLPIRLWKAIADSAQSGVISPEFVEIRKRAMELGKWETVRDCEFHRAKLGKDRPALVRLYFGTPFESYRAKIRTALGGGRERGADGIPERYYWSGRSKKGCSRIFDLSTAICHLPTYGGTTGGPPSVGPRPDGKYALTAGQALHRLLILLCRDFYRPLPLREAFGALYPDEFFHPVSSPGRVRNLIRRLRAWLRECELPLELVEQSGDYRLEFKGGLSIALPRQPLSLDPTELGCLRLGHSFKTREFTRRDVARELSLSLASATRLLAKAVERGKIVRLGRTNSARYRLAG